MEGLICHVPMKGSDILRSNFRGSKISGAASTSSLPAKVLPKTRIPVASELRDERTQHVSHLTRVASVQAPPQTPPAASEDLSSADIIRLESELFVHTYARAPVVFVRGEGSKLYDVEGREYIDMAGGIAVNALGHADSSWVKAVVEQAGKLAHVSNLYHTVPQVQLAQRLIAGSFADKMFFTNSGTEANEAAIKFARKYQQSKQTEGGAGGLGLPSWLGLDKPATEFVSFSNCFHGRTMGALSLTYKEQYRTPFQPVMPGAETFATYGDLASAATVIKKGKTAGVFVEPVQGEGGIFPASKEFLAGLRKLCDDAGALLIFDEVSHRCTPADEIERRIIRVKLEVWDGVSIWSIMGMICILCFRVHHA